MRGRLVGLREQFGDFIGPPRKKRRPKPRPPAPTPATHARPDGDLPRVNDSERVRCSVCARVTAWRCFKLSKGRGEKGCPMRLLEIMLDRDLHEDDMRARYSAQVDGAQYVAFWMCTESGHVTRERMVA